MFGLFKRLGQIQVVDGDTVKRDGTTYRLMGFDAPETVHAHSVHEHEIGEKAAERLRVLISAPNKVKLRPTGRRDRFDRVLAVLYVNGEDVAQIAVREGWAVPFHGEKRSKRPDWEHTNY